MTQERIQAQIHRMELNAQIFYSLGILGATLIVVPAVKGVLREIKLADRWEFLKTALPSCANFIYLFGFEAAAEISPLSANVTRWIDGGIYILGAFLLIRLARMALMSALEFTTRRLSKNSEFAALEQGFVPLLKNLITIFVFLTGAIMVLRHFNYDVLSLLAALGVGSLAVGLAAQDTLKNMISGFTLIIDRNLHPGDRINLGGIIGDVEEIGLRSTRLRVPENHILIVPNSDLVNTKILNLSLPSRHTPCSTQFKLLVSADFARTRDCLNEVLKPLLKSDSRFSSNREPQIILSSLAEGAQTIQVTFWVDDFTHSSWALGRVNEVVVHTLTSLQIPLWAAPRG